MRLAALVVALVAGACHPHPRPTAAPALPPPATRAEVAIHDLHPGVLRGLAVEGVQDVAGAPPERSTRVSVCLDADGVATTSMIESSGDVTYDEAVMATVAAWRFRPYVRDGAAAPACARAVFNDQQPAGLPEAADELPRSTARPGNFGAGETRVPATPGVALAETCRERGRRTAPRVTFLQSSGDPVVDRALLDQRAAMARGEAGGGEVCRIDAAIAIETPPRPPITPNISARDLELRRLSGNMNVFPSDPVKNAIHARRMGDLLIPIKVCISHDGRVDEVEVMKPTGLIAYEADLLNAVASFRYKPMTIDGRPIRICSAVQFLYRQRF